MNPIIIENLNDINFVNSPDGIYTTIDINPDKVLHVEKSGITKAIKNNIGYQPVWDYNCFDGEKMIDRYLCFPKISYCNYPYCTYSNKIYDLNKNCIVCDGIGFGNYSVKNCYEKKRIIDIRSNELIMKVKVKITEDDHYTTFINGNEKILIYDNIIYIERYLLYESNGDISSSIFKIDLRKNSNIVINIWDEDNIYCENHNNNIRRIPSGYYYDFHIDNNFIYAINKKESLIIEKCRKIKNKKNYKFISYNRKNYTFTKSKLINCIVSLEDKVDDHYISDRLNYLNYIPMYLSGI